MDTTNRFTFSTISPRWGGAIVILAQISCIHWYGIYHDIEPRGLNFNLQR